MADTIVGIDLGTTNSEVAYIRDGQPVVCSEDGDPILPSFVGLSEDGRLLVGKAARNQWVVAPERTIKSIKRLMGQDVKVKLGDQEYRPQEISAMILRSLRERASKVLGSAKSSADLGQSFGATLTEAEVKYLMAHEWALSADDIVWRRSKLGLRLSADQIAVIDDWIASHRTATPNPLLEAGGRS